MPGQVGLPVSLSDKPTVAPGERLRFAVAGEKPLSKFVVAFYGPAVNGESGKLTYPVRTVLTARADKKGEAIIVLDTRASCPTGEFVAVVDPQASFERPASFESRTVFFSVSVPTGH